MRQSLILLMTFLAVSFATFSQSENQPDRRFVNKFYDANAFIYEDNYNAAVPLLDELNTIEPDNANIQYLLGLCYLKSRIYQKKAEEKLEYASGYISETYEDDNHREQNAPPLTWFFLGQAYRVNLEFEKSIKAFKKFLEYLDTKEKTQEVKLNKEETIRQIKITKRAKRMVNAPVSVDMVNMGQVINSSYSDHSPIIDVHESKMIYTSKRPRAGEPFYNQDEDLFVSTKHKGDWGNPERMGDHINTDENEASIGLSSEGDILLFFRSEYHAGNIFTTEKEKDSIEWSKPKQLTEEINTKNRETHACISPDNQSIYFTSDRPGGSGGLDIYVVRRLPTGEFGEPRRLGPNVNTEYDEETPFIHPDGQTLFFSSKGHNTMGGYDIFYSKMNEDYTFGLPTNLGYPINTTGDNVAYVMSMDGRRGYLSTYREDGYGDLDIYMIKHKDVFITNLAIYEGTVNDTEGEVPEDVIIVVRDSKTNAISGVYRPNKYTGEYILSLRPGAEYDIIYNVMGRQMVTKTLKPQKEDADQFLESYRPVELDPVIIQLYAYHDKVLFEQGKTEMTASGNRVIDKMSSLVDTTRASMAITINYPPSHPLSPERFEVVKQALIKAGVDEVDIVAQGEIPSYAEIVYGLDITEGEELFLDIDLAAKGEIDRGEIVVENILFDFDKYNIKPIYYENLNRLAGFMRNNTDAVIEIAGHTDHIGSNEYNYLLSYRRAKAVKDYLVNKGVSSSSLITRKYGESAPIAPNVIQGKDYPEGRRLNRRAEFNVLKEGSYDKLRIQPINTDIDVIPPELEEKLADEEFVAETKYGKFTIQIFALENRRSINYFDDLIGVQEHVGDDGLYRYYVGSFDSKREARSAMQNLREMGYEPFIREKSFFE
ncbi:MAG: OmpA family protein [Bacteroidota bacterium]|nr:OmpA family protein [Bacteroidota bacterium]